MTDERQALFELIEKRADTDFVGERLAFAAERLMDVEVEALSRGPPRRAYARKDQSP